MNYTADINYLFCFYRYIYSDRFTINVLKDEWEHVIDWNTKRWVAELNWRPTLEENDG